MACWIHGILLRIVLTGFCDSKGKTFHHTLMQKEYLFTPRLLKVGRHTSFMDGYVPNSLLQVLSIFSQLYVNCKPLLKERQDRLFFCGILANWVHFGKIKYKNLCILLRSFLLCGIRTLKPELLNDLFKEVIKNSEQFLPFSFLSWCLYYSYWSHFCFPVSFPNFLTYNWQDLPGT